MLAHSCAPKLSGSGFISARVSEFCPSALCYVRAYIVTPINMFFSYLSTRPHFIIDSGT